MKTTNIELGAVSSRVALLLRSAEAKPWFSDLFMDAVRSIELHSWPPHPDRTWIFGKPCGFLQVHRKVDLSTRNPFVKGGFRHLLVI